MTQSPRNMKGAVSFFSSLSESAVRKNATWYNKCQSFTKSPLPAASHWYSLISFLWLFGDVHILKGIHKFETINIAFIFLSPYFHLSLVARRKRLCIFFPLAIVQMSYRTWVWLPGALLSSAVLHYSSHSAVSLPVSQWDWRHLSLLKNGLLPSSCPSVVGRHLEAGSSMASAVRGAAVSPSRVCSGATGKALGLPWGLPGCPDTSSLEGVLSAVRRRQRRTLH